jgi:hypothetical protein
MLASNSSNVKARFEEMRRDDMITRKTNRPQRERGKEERECPTEASGE